MVEFGSSGATKRFPLMLMTSVRRVCGVRGAGLEEQAQPADVADGQLLQGGKLGHAVELAIFADAGQRHVVQIRFAVGRGAVDAGLDRDIGVIDDIQNHAAGEEGELLAVGVSHAGAVVDDRPAATVEGDALRDDACRRRQAHVVDHSFAEALLRERSILGQFDAALLAIIVGLGDFVGGARDAFENARDQGGRLGRRQLGGECRAHQEREADGSRSHGHITRGKKACSRPERKPEEHSFVRGTPCKAGRVGGNEKARSGPDLLPHSAGFSGV